ncbi:TonB-dependent receptor [Kineobactrum salinum]|uniref:TonB-dependent receptor n=1 Tax=Kineobactrum salinum TaxID=2708301 RepID=A0A6C0U4H0_9GAMM|nr:TonB-dependent receptor [Kineobactrum salinum]QIB66828.1 TonB-dependent receptor [Kineobactrum salinum]
MMNIENINLYQFKIVVLWSTLLSLAPGAHSQTEDSRENSNQKVVLEEIIVTARGRNESLQEIPIAISVLTEEDIERRGIASVEDIALSTPNVNFNQGLGLNGFFLSLRGQNSERYSPPPVAAVVDGVLQMMPAQFNVDEFGLEQIEVLKGPQGAIYGKNAIAGAFNMRTAKPDEEFEGKLFARGAEGDERVGKVLLSGPIIREKLGLLGGVSRVKRRGQIKNVNNGEYVDKYEDTTKRARAVITPFEYLEIDLKYTDSETIGPDPTYIESESGNPEKTDDPIDSDGVGLSERDLKDRSARIVLHTPYASIIGVFADVDVVERSRLDLDSLPIPLAMGDQIQTDEGSSREFRIQSSGNGWFDWMIGRYDAKQEQLRDSILFLSNPVTGEEMPGLGSVELYKSESKAIFGALSYYPLDSLKIDLEYRYDKNPVTKIPKNGFSPGVGNPVPMEPEPPQSTTFRERQPKGTITYTPTSDISIYVSAGKGFRSGEFNPSSRTFGDDIVKAETAKNYEIGAKTSWLNRRLIVNAAIFETDVENTQFKLFDIQAGTSIGVNYDKVRIKGFEVESTYRIHENIGVNIAIGYVDAEVEEFTLPEGIEGEPSDFEGNRPQRVPKYTGNLGFDVSFPVYDNLSAFLRAQYRYTSTYFWDPLNDFERPSEELLSVRAGFSGYDNRWSLTFFVENALDETSTSDYQPVTVTGSPFMTDVYATPIQKLIGMEAMLRF